MHTQHTAQPYVTANAFHYYCLQKILNWVCHFSVVCDKEVILTFKLFKKVSKAKYCMLQFVLMSFLNNIYNM